MNSPVKRALDYCLLGAYCYYCWSFSILVLVCSYFLTLMGSNTLLGNLLISLVCLFPWNTISGSNLMIFFFFYFCGVIFNFSLINDFIWAFSLFFFEWGLSVINMLIFSKDLLFSIVSSKNFGWYWKSIMNVLPFTK